MRANLSRWGLSLVVVAGWLLAGCSPKPDVGDPCTIDVTTGGAAVDACHVAGDWLETGVVGCENLVCILSPAPAATCGGPLTNGVCSKPCVADSDCFPDQTGLHCRQVVLDEGYINAITNNNPALLDKYLPADIRLSSYCAFAPLTQ